MKDPLPKCLSKHPPRWMTSDASASGYVLQLSSRWKYTTDRMAEDSNSKGPIPYTEYVTSILLVYWLQALNDHKLFGIGCLECTHQQLKPHIQGSRSPTLFKRRSRSCPASISGKSRGMVHI